jgi:diaminohydroxyphosphoribosylaminopyrimidine deaminase/5-amino-6-(5-phosphoribosylamino)uracil reductase
MAAGTRSPLRVSSSPRDAVHVARCLLIAARAEGRTSPNPMVGAVLVKNGRVIAEAHHRRAGWAHAEAAALRRAGAAARGATLYVNLEPCAHFGRTPPCVNAIIEAGVRRVVASHRDPFPLVNGRGFAALRRAGVAVSVGALRADAMRLNEAYLCCLAHRRPFVHVKAAVSLDGRIATPLGASRWISSPASRRVAHRMRAASNAILVGAGTVRRDDPALTVRPPVPREAHRAPLRVVLDSRLSIDERARLLSRGRGGSVIIYCTREASTARAGRLRARGATVVPVAADRAGRVSLRAALGDLCRRGVARVLLEGGGEVIASAIEAGVVDKVSLFVAPLVLGGRAAVPLVGGAGVSRPGTAPRLRRIEVRRVGPDLLVEGYLRPIRRPGVSRSARG